MLNDLKKNGKIISAPGLVDSHFHILSMKSRAIDPSKALQVFFDQGGAWALDVGINLDHWDQRISYHQIFPLVFFAAGLHPSEASKTLASWSEILEKQLDHPLCCAVGEIGLDFCHGKEFFQEQETLFRCQLEIAKTKALPIIIHNRDADKDVLRILNEVSWKGEGIVHCFSSSIEVARQFLDLGFVLSFAGNVTYKGSDDLRQVACFVPSDRYLIETDAPYLTPIPMRGQVNQPFFAAYTAAFLAHLKGKEMAMVLQETAATFARLFSDVCRR